MNLTARCLSVRTKSRNEFINVTREIQNIISSSGIINAICFLHSPHTTCGLTLNEVFDPDVLMDMGHKLSDLIPHNDGYRHSEGNSDAHIKTSLLGCQVFVPVINGVLSLGRWQGIILCEFDGPRTRKVEITVLQENETDFRS